MINFITKYRVTDNSGVRLFKGIKVYKKTPYSKIELGNSILGSIQNIKLKRKSRLKKLTKGELKKSILVRTKNKLIRFDGSSIKFFENSIILIDAKNKPLASRILGLLPIDLRKLKNLKLLLITQQISL